MRRFFERMLIVFAAHVRAMLLTPWDVGAVAIVEQAGRVLLVRHSYKSGWLFPGGAVKRGEPPAEAVMRELKEEIGLTQSASPQLLGIYTRRWLWAANLILVYRVRDAVFAFRPNWEVRAVRLIDPVDPPDGVGPAIRRRLRELIGDAVPNGHW
ncbi:NUDIX domain-containing protein [Rhizomicrobium electricum]|nr:NUDIX domain-containing protein [Rhizomicrobium electricum]NIJ49576.1 8-oxo-dGTP pyrophosphatase MutT (NUDIX family) [Rhizomicrobium electricum]